MKKNKIAHFNRSIRENSQSPPQALSASPSTIAEEQFNEDCIDNVIRSLGKKMKKQEKKRPKKSFDKPKNRNKLLKRKYKKR